MTSEDYVVINNIIKNKMKKLLQVWSKGAILLFVAVKCCGT